MDTHGGSKVFVIGHENVKKYNNCPIKIEINYINSILSLFYHGLTVNANIVVLAVAWGKIMRHKWSVPG